MRLLPRAALTFIVASRSVSAEPMERFPDVGERSGNSASSSPNGAPARAAQLPPPVIARSRGPNGSRALLERGARHEQAGRVAEALVAYTEAVRLDPSNGGALLALGRLRVRMNDPREAEAILSAATNFSDVAPQAFAERAKLLKSRGHDDEALLDLENAVALAPDETAWSEELARWYVARRAWLPALSVYRRLRLELRGTSRERNAALEVQALQVLAGDLDPVARGRSPDYSFARRSLARLADK